MSTSMIIRALALVLASASLVAQQVGGGDARTVKVYDLGSGLVPPGPDLEVRGPGGKAEPEWTQSSKGTAVVAQMVRAFVQPPLAADEDVQPLRERWVVLLGRAEQHAWVERYLAAARRQRDQVITIKCELFAMPETFYVEKVAPALAQEGKPAGSPVILAPGDGTAAFRKALTDEESCMSMSAPTLAVRPLEPASVSLLRDTSYVRDFEVEVAKAAFIANPVGDVVHDGVAIEAAAAMLQDGVAGVSLKVSVADLKRPIPVFTTTLGGSTLPVKIQLPQVLTTQARAAVEVPRSHTVAIALPAMAGKRHLLLLTVE